MAASRTMERTRQALQKPIQLEDYGETIYLEPYVSVATYQLARRAQNWCDGLNTIWKWPGRASKNVSRRSPPSDSGSETQMPVPERGRSGVFGCAMGAQIVWLKRSLHVEPLRVGNAGAGYGGRPYGKKNND